MHLPKADISRRSLPNKQSDPKPHPHFLSKNIRGGFGGGGPPPVFNLMIEIDTFGRNLTCQRAINAKQQDN